MNPSSKTPDGVALTARHGAVFVIVASALTLLLLTIVASDALPFGVPSVWVWQYLPLKAPARLGFALVPLGAVGALLPLLRGLWHQEKPARRDEVKGVVALWTASFLAACGVILMHPMGWMHPATLVINPAANSYFLTALQHPDTRALLHHYERTMPTLISHAQTQSAGPVVFSRAVKNLADVSPLTPIIADTLFALSPGVDADFVARFCRRWNSQIQASDARAALVVALMMVAIGSCAVAPIYLLGKWLHSPQTGILAAGGFVLLPGFHSFSVSVDQMYPFAVASALCGVWMALHSRRGVAWAVLTGAWLGLCVWMNLGLIVAVALCLAFAAFVRAQEASRSALTWRALGVRMAALVGGLLGVWLLLWQVFQYNIVAVFQISNALRDALYYNARSYGGSLWGNLLDFWVFCGLPVTLLFAWRVLRAIRKREMMPLACALLIVLLLLDVSGRVRGEAARLLMFLMPVVLIVAASQARELWRTSRLGVAVLIALQLAQVVTFQYFVRVWGY